MKDSDSQPETNHEGDDTMSATTVPADKFSELRDWRDHNPHHQTQKNRIEEMRSTVTVTIEPDQVAKQVEAHREVRANLPTLVIPDVWPMTWIKKFQHRRNRRRR